MDKIYKINIDMKNDLGPLDKNFKTVITLAIIHIKMFSGLGAWIAYPASDVISALASVYPLSKPSIERAEMPSSSSKTIPIYPS